MLAWVVEAGAPFHELVAYWQLRVLEVADACFAGAEQRVRSLSTESLWQEPVQRERVSGAHLGP
jgi:hypothetical protein